MQALDTAPQKLEWIVAKWLNQLTSCRLKSYWETSLWLKGLGSEIPSIKNLLVSGLSSEWYGIVDL